MNASAVIENLPLRRFPAMPPVSAGIGFRGLMPAQLLELHLTNPSASPSLDNAQMSHFDGSTLFH